METFGKHLRLCDSCSKPFKTGDEDRDLRIKATLFNDKMQHQNFDFCKEGCLLAFLQKRAKKKLSKACLLDAVFTVR